jgi:hypothetical protein
VGMLDIGYEKHRIEYGYETYCRLSDVKLGYGICTHPLGSLEAYTEVGFPVIGYEAFTLEVDPSKDLTLLLRTGKKLKALIRTQGAIETTPQFSSPLQLNVMVNDQQAKRSSHDLKDTGYTEIAITIPHQDLDDTTAEIVVGGDHISFAYWFYQ